MIRKLSYRIAMRPMMDPSIDRMMCDGGSLRDINESCVVPMFGGRSSRMRAQESDCAIRGDHVQPCPRALNEKRLDPERKEKKSEMSS